MILVHIPITYCYILLYIVMVRQSKHLIFRSGPWKIEKPVIYAEPYRIPFETVFYF